MIERLPWDSDFFGFPVGKLALDERDQAITLFDIQHDVTDFHVCYIFSQTELKNEACLFQDEKVVFEIMTNQLAPYWNESIIVGAPQDYEGLLDLALSSGAYSRFKLDTKFVSQFAKLYAEWLMRSLCKELADEVFVFRKQNLNAGFVTVKTKSGIAEIGLIATDEHFRGCGIGTSLMNAVLNYAQAHGCDKVRVATQRRNQQAIDFYIKNGFKEVENIFIYHLWQ